MVNNLTIDGIVDLMYIVDTAEGRIYLRTKLSGSRYQVGDEVTGRKIVKQGYIVIQLPSSLVGGRPVLIKRSKIVWRAHHGSWPINTIDHWNRIRTDDKIKNLRDVTQAINNLNRGVAPVSGIHHVRPRYTGFYYRRWHQGKNIGSHTFKTPQAAATLGYQEWLHKTGQTT